MEVGAGMLAVSVDTSEYSSCKNAKYISRHFRLMDQEGDTLLWLNHFLRENIWNVKSGHRFYSYPHHVPRGLFYDSRVISLAEKLVTECSLSTDLPTMGRFIRTYFKTGVAIYLLYSDDSVGHFLEMDVEEYLSWWVMTEDPRCAILYPVVMLPKMGRQENWSR